MCACAHRETQQSITTHTPPNRSTNTGKLRPHLASELNSRIELILAHSCQTTKKWREFASNDESGINTKALSEPSLNPPNSRVVNFKRLELVSLFLSLYLNS